MPEMGLTVANPPVLAIPEIEQADLELLGRVTPLYETLVDSIAPQDKLETYEQVAAVYFRVSSQFAAKGWQFLMLIKQEGLWKLIRDGEGYPRWTNFYDYAQNFFEGIKSMRRRTIASRVSMAETLMIELGLNAQDAGALLDDKPSIAAQALDAMQFDEFNGHFIGLKDGVRENLLKELGVSDGEHVNDKQLAVEYLQRVAVAEHHEASALVHRVQDNMSVWLSYDSKTGEIFLNGYGRVPGEKTIQMFRIPFALKHPSKRMPQAARNFLNTKLRPDFKGKPNEQ